MKMTHAMIAVRDLRIAAWNSFAAYPYRQSPFHSSPPEFHSLFVDDQRLSTVCVSFAT
jgi:hypothetical protein